MKTNNPYPLRIEEDLMDDLVELADYNSRSVNREIEYLIKVAVREYKQIKENNETAEKTVKKINKYG